MPRKPHDHNFKNLFQDFPKEALEFFYPLALQKLGPVRDITFERQEPKKHVLSDAGLALDMPILFTFAKEQLVLWLVEFQEDKRVFSIYKLSRYTIDKMEANPRATVIPMVLFTDRKKWRKDVARGLESRFFDHLFLHFEYRFVKLFDFNARDFYNTRNPLVKVLLPKMNYKPEERMEVICQAYTGLFQLASRGLFNKYVDFIDTYAEVNPQEKEEMYHHIVQHKETVMLAQYIRELGWKDGEKEGKKEGILLIARENLIDALELRFGDVQNSIREKIDAINDPATLKDLFRKALLTKSINEFERSC